MTSPGNVTPFPGPRKPPPKGPDLRGPALAMYGLAIVSLALFLSGRQFADLLAIAAGVAAVAIAAGRRDEGPAWIRAHYEFGLRTVVIAGALWTLLSLLASLGGFVPLLIDASWWARVGIGLWLVVRCLYGAVQTLRRKIISNPRTAFL